MAGVTIETLGRVPLFAELEPEELEVIANAMSERTFRDGESVTIEGTPADAFFVVESGEADVSVEGQPRGSVGPGDYFGEIALLMGSERTATITATGDLHCYALTPSAFRVIVEGNPFIAMKVLQSADELS